MAEPLKPNQAKAAKAASRDLPPGPSFLDLVKNKSRSPLSLSEFMDYLIYIEHNAENLQFFLWYSDFVQRWSRLPRRRKSTSPQWNMACQENAGGFRTCPLAAHKRATSEKMANILEILDRASDKEELEPYTPGSILEDPTSEDGENKEFVTSTRISEYPTQPFRDELMRIARNYIEDGAPRQLKLSAWDRASILEALQHTTHPASLLPAFTMSRNILREFSHPGFIKWSLYRNANRPRVNFTCAMAAVLIVLGLGLNVILTLSGLSTYFRALGIILLWPGITWLVAAAKGLCLDLHFQRVRQQRPWEAQQHPERDVELEQAISPVSPVDKDDNTMQKLVFSPIHPELQTYQNSWYGWPPKDGRRHHNSILSTAADHRPSVKVSHSASVTRTALRKYSMDSSISVVGFSTVITGGHDKSRGHVSTTLTGVDTLRKSRMQSLGPSNDYSHEAWYREEDGPSLLGRVFTATVPARNRDLHLIQDRLVLRVVVLGGLFSALITCIFLFLPVVNLLFGIGAGK